MKSKIINTLIIVITLLSINIIPCHAEVKTYNRNELWSKEKYYNNR